MLTSPWLTFPPGAIHRLCRYHVTFEKLIETASQYWHISPLRYVVSDQSGTHFLRRMSVLEGLSLAPPSTMLCLIPLHQEQRLPGQGAASAAAVDTGPTAKQLRDEVDKMLKARAKQQSRLFGKASALLAQEDDLQARRALPIPRLGPPRHHPEPG